MKAILMRSGLLAIVTATLPLAAHAIEIKTPSVTAPHVNVLNVPQAKTPQTNIQTNTSNNVGGKTISTNHQTGAGSPCNAAEPGCAPNNSAGKVELPQGSGNQPSNSTYNQANQMLSNTQKLDAATFNAIIGNAKPQ